MGRATSTRAFLEALLALPLPPLVLDADALNLLTELEGWPSRLPADTILTPHPGEMARLCGTTTAELPNDRRTLAAQKARDWRAIVVLKGAHTVIASPEGQIAVSPFKNAALAKGGTGDVLAGLVTGLRAQGMSAFEAACSAVYIHGLAGEITTRITSPRSVLAGDIAAQIGTALMHIERP
jgi:NAD(P)H-hydrate epimerase